MTIFLDLMAIFVFSLDLIIEHRGKVATLFIWRTHIRTNDAGEGELVAVQTVRDQEHLLPSRTFI
jgi:hypothetical protein